MTPIEQAEKLLSNSAGKFQGCRIWNGAVDNNGFAYAKVGGKKVLVHRYVKLHWVEHDELATSRLSRMRLENTCGHTNCIEPRHWQFKTSKPEKVYESDEALRKLYASYLV